MSVTAKISDNSLYILKERYLEPDESVNQMFVRVAANDADFIRIMANLEFLPNSPTLMNAGTQHEGRSTFSACFKFDVDDSMLEGEDSIIETGRKAAAVAKWGGGVGYYLGNLRPKNAPIRSVHRVACGPIAVLRYYNVIGKELITQGGRRELAQMGILGCDHADLREFIHVKDTDPQALKTFNISVAAHDKFMSAAIGGFPPEKALWDEITMSAWKSGDPGLYFPDTAEATNPTPWLGKLTGTNPCGEVPLLNNEACLDGASLIDTPDGLIPIGELVHKSSFSVHTHDQNTVSDCKAVYKGTRATIRFRLNSGQVIRCTPDHKILTDRGWMEAGQLQIGSRVRVANVPTTLAGIEEHKTDEMLGWFLSDGWLTHEDSSGILFAEDDKEAMTKLMSVWDDFVEKDYKLQTQPTGVKQKSCEKVCTVAKFTALGFTLGKAITKTLPTYILTSKPAKQLAFLRGLFSADGGIRKAGCGKRNLISLSSSSRKLLEQVQILLMRFGIQSNLVWTKFKTELRNDQGNLNIAGKSALAFREKIGFNLSAKNNAFEPGERVNNNHQYFKVTKIEQVGDTEVYDIMMPSKHHFIANGVVVHNCNLGSINLSKFVTTNRTVNWDKLEETVRIAVRFLDNILDRNCFPHPAITAAVAKTRKIGLGVMGWADMLALLHIHYDTKVAVELGRKLMKFINAVGHAESVTIGKAKGAFPADQASTQRRNATVTCIAPTGSISVLADSSSGIEPHYSLEWSRTLHAGHGDREKVIQERISVWDRLDGFVPKTAMEIPYEWHIQHTAAFQENTDLAVSKTINLPNSATVEDVRSAYKMLWELGCKGGTIFRDGCRSNGEQVLKAKPAVTVNGAAIVATIEAKPATRTSCRQKPNKDRDSKTHHITIGDFDGYIHAGTYPDGRLCEVFITASKEGSTVSGMLDSWSIAVSHALQYGDPLEDLVKKYSGMRFEPSGVTGYPEIPICTSIVDYVVRWLDKKFGAGKGLTDYKGQEVHSGNICPDCDAPAIYQGGCLTCKNSCGWSRCG